MKLQTSSAYANNKALIYTAAILAIFLVGLAIVLPRVAAQGEGKQTAVVPTFTVDDVVTDTSVTITTADFPPHQEFLVTMGPNGTQGIDGTVVGSINSGVGGSFTASFPIPDSLKGAERIAMRLESPQGFFAYNWFYNNLAKPRNDVPSFIIESVIPNEAVTIHTFNFPAGRSFLVMMGHMGTDAVDGIPVGTIDTGAGGELLASFDIPEPLQGLERIAIRAESGPYFAYNWFGNEAPEETVVPDMRICEVVRDQSITIVTRNTFPPNREFAVLMNFMGTLGTGGYVTGTFNSGPTGVVTGTYPIPDGLRGLDQIAVRADEIGGPYYAFDYTNNQTAVYCGPEATTAP